MMSSVNLTIALTSSPGYIFRQALRLPAGFMGKSALNVSANDLMWELFKKHKLK